MTAGENQIIAGILLNAWERKADTSFLPLFLHLFKHFPQWNSS
jgi:hypothetical protein